MKASITTRFALLLVLLLTTTDRLLAQMDRPWESTGAVGLRSAFSREDQRRVYVVTDAGSLWTSTDDGNSWHSEGIDAMTGLNFVKFYGGYGIIGADSNRIYYKPGEKNWTRRDLPSQFGLNAFAWPSFDTIFACGNRGTMLRSIDHGMTWQTQALPGSVNMLGLHAVTSRELYSNADSGYLYHTSNAGESWERTHLAFAGNRLLRSMAISPSGYLFACTDTMVGVSTDGLHWTTNVLNPVFGSWICYATFASDDTLMVFPFDYFRFYSTDRGKTWQKDDYRNADPSVGIILQQYFDGWKTSTGGLRVIGTGGTIIDVPRPATQASVLHTESAAGPVLLEGIRGSDKEVHGIQQAGGGDFLYSSDAGISWTTRKEPNVGQGSYIGLHFTTTDSGVVIASQPRSKNFDPSSATTDNGISWSQIKLAQLPHRFWVNTSEGSDGSLFITGDTDIYYSTNGGHEWNSWGTFHYQDTQIYITRSGFFGLDSAYCSVSWINKKDRNVYNGLISTTDRGVTWKNSPVGNLRSFLYAFSYPTSTRCLVAAANGQVGITEDRGDTWRWVQVGPPKITLRSFAFNRRKTIGIVGGDSGFVAYTLDSGNTWREDRTHSFQRLVASAAISWTTAINDSVFTCGSGGTIFRKTYSLPSKTTGAVNKNSREYLFISTYPSPASSIIHCILYGLYTLTDPRTIRVTLSNVMGETVRDLTTDALDAKGVSPRQFDIDATGLSSGTYFVTLYSAAGIVTRALTISK